MDSNRIAGLAFVFDVSRVTHFSQTCCESVCATIFRRSEVQRFVFDDAFHPNQRRSDLDTLSTPVEVFLI
jgi:hypothetical protein